jgi:hypothetical protein
MKLNRLMMFAAAALLAACTIQVPSTGGTPPTSGTTTPPPATANAYPFQQPAGYTGGIFEIGTGPDRLEVDVTKNPASGPDNRYPNTLAILVGDKVVVASWEVQTFMGMGLSPNDNIIVHGTFGAATTPDLVKIVGTAPHGINSLFINGVSLNYQPLVTNSCGDNRAGCATASGNCAAGGCASNSTALWDNTRLPATFGTSIYVAPPPPPVPETAQTVISGATCNEIPIAPGTLAQVVPQCASGTLHLPAGTFLGTAPVASAITIAGAGMGKTIIDGSGLHPTYTKAGFVPLVPGVVFQDLTLRNFAVSDADGANGAGIRESGDGIGFKAIRVEFSDNQDGVLTYIAQHDFIDCVFHDNGPTAAFSAYGHDHDHNAYINGNPSAVLNVSGTTSYAPTAVHAWKTRSGINNFTDDVFTAGGNGAALDVPDGGTVNVDGLTLIQPGTGETHNVLTLGLESANNAAAGMVLNSVRKGLQIEDPAGVANVICANGFVVNLTSGNDTYKGPKDGPNIVGCTVNGAFKKVN